jgi:hypothetical protein
MDPITTPRRTELVSITSEPRPTPRAEKARFSEVLANGASGLVQGAEMVVSSLPGGPIVAAAVRGGVAPAQPAGLPLPLGGVGGLGGLGGVGGVGGGSTVAEGPGALGALGSLGTGTSGDGGISASLAQSQQSNLYYLQVQQQVNAQSQTFETLSNVLKSESDTIKNAISNLH